jgi:hypothetical protein
MYKRYCVRTIIIILLVTATGVIFTGCATDIPFAPDDPVVRPAPGIVLVALQDAYESMSIEAYSNLLHPDYRFIFDDPHKAPYGRDDDLASTGRMFSGVDQKNSEGRDAPAVASIAFNRLEILGDWEPAADGEVSWSDETEVWRAEIRYGFVLYLKNERKITAGGRQIVYAVAVKTEDWDGSLYWRWQLLGQHDQ